MVCYLVGFVLFFGDEQAAQSDVGQKYRKRQVYNKDIKVNFLFINKRIKIKLSPVETKVSDNINQLTLVKSRGRTHT